MTEEQVEALIANINEAADAAFDAGTATFPAQLKTEEYRVVFRCGFKLGFLESSKNSKIECVRILERIVADCTCANGYRRVPDFDNVRRSTELGPLPGIKKVQCRTCSEAREFLKRSGQ